MFISSLLMTVIQLGVLAIGAEPHSLGGGLVYFVVLVVGEALMLRLCLGWFGWTISIKAAVVARFLAGGRVGDLRPDGVRSGSAP